MDGELVGGNMNAVQRRGDTVLRTAGPWTPTVHRYLNYLIDGGIDWIPVPLGIEGEREVLSFVDGEVPLYPLPEWVWEDSVLVDGARRLRALHDASTGFALDGAVWQAPSKVPMEVICHNDFSPHNLAFVDGTITGAIDFDFCSPGPRIWDLAYFATRIVPLTGEPPEGAPSGAAMRQRAQLVLDAYGTHHSLPELIGMAVRRLTDLAAFSVSKAEELERPRLRDDAVYYRREAAFLTRTLHDGRWSAREAGPQ